MLFGRPLSEAARLRPGRVPHVPSLVIACCDSLRAAAAAKNGVGGPGEDWLLQAPTQAELEALAARLDEGEDTAAKVLHLLLSLSLLFFLIRC